MRKGSKWYSIVYCRCPRCHEGDYFVTQNPYNLKKFTKIHDECKQCKQPFIIEPGFYFGAAYISYFFNVALFGMYFLASFLYFPSISNLFFIGIYTLITLLLTPLIYRYSRIAYLNIFVGYKNSDTFDERF